LTFPDVQVAQFYPISICLRKSYIFYSEEDGGYIADIPDLEACAAFGETPAKALAEVEIAKIAWLEAARAEGKPIPLPHYRPVIYQLAA
jgi:predicted RNase H-like HicB family nuclease